jgi:hypothetical protein
MDARNNIKELGLIFKKLDVVGTYIGLILLRVVGSR